jgi:hypothetical protein
MPVASAMTPAMNQTSTQIVDSEMPTDSAAWWSSPSARMARPIFDLLRNRMSPATRRMAPMTAVRSFCSIDTKPPNGSKVKLPVGM